MCQGVNVAARVVFGKGTVLSVLPGEQALVLESAIASFLSCSWLFGGPHFWEAQCLHPCLSPGVPCICFSHTSPCLLLCSSIKIRFPRDSCAWKHFQEQDLLRMGRAVAMVMTCCLSIGAEEQRGGLGERDTLIKWCSVLVCDCGKCQLWACAKCSALVPPAPVHLGLRGSVPMWPRKRLNA